MYIGCRFETTDLTLRFRRQTNIKSFAVEAPPPFSKAALCEFLVELLVDANLVTI